MIPENTEATEAQYSGFDEIVSVVFVTEFHRDWGEQIETLRLV